MQLNKPSVDYSTASIESLVALTQQGRSEAFRYIVIQHNQRLYRVARAVLNDDDEAQDALQDAYVNAYLHISDFKGQAKLSSWLTRIVLNACYQRLREKRPTVELSLLESTDATARIIPFPQINNAMSDPAIIAAQDKMRSLIEDAISQLPEVYRTTFVLRDIEGLSTQETADTLQIKGETVKTRLFRARKLMREALNKHINNTLDNTFLFLGSRCASLTDKVMQRIASLNHPH